MTFNDSKSAYRAIHNCKHIKGNLRILLADTWKQPNANDESPFVANNDEISLNQLNEYCLLDVFDYLNLESLMNMYRVCNSFNDIIRNQIFPRQRKIILDLRMESEDPPTILHVWDVFKNVLQYANEIKLEMDLSESPPNHIRLMDIFTKKLNANLVRLELTGVNITNRMYEQMKPVLNQLKIFKWDCDHFYDDNYELDLVNACKQLKKLKLLSFMDFNINANKWHSLESLTICLNRFHVNDTNIRFYRNNPQLKRLKIDIQHHFSSIKDISFYLKNLECLKIYCYDGGEARYFRDLIHLVHLKTLRLATTCFENGNYQIFITILSQIISLEKLEINVEYNGNGNIFVPDQCQLITLATNLVNLKEFYIGRYKLTEDTLIEFIKARPQLEIFKFDDCDLMLNEDLLKKISNDRKIQAERVKMNNIKPLKIYVDEDPYSYENLCDYVKVHLIEQDANDFEFLS